MVSKEPESPSPGDITKIKKLLRKDQELINGWPPAFLVAKHISDYRLNIGDVLDALSTVEIGRFVGEINKQVRMGNFIPLHSKMAERIVRNFTNRLLKVVGQTIDEGGVSDPANDEFSGSPNYYR